MRRLMLVAAGTLALYLVVLVLMAVGQRALLYPASRERVTPAQAGLASMREIVLETADGERLVAWWQPPRPGRAVIVYFHGNGGSLSNRRARAATLLQDGRGLLLASYRGYSGSTGSPSEAGLALDARAAYAWVASAYEADRIVLYGESLGSGVAVRLATESPVAGLVLDAPYTSIVDAARRLYWWLPVDLLLRDRFPSLDRIARIGAPLLVLHGEADRLVPIGLGERLFAAAPEPKRLVRLPGGHLTNLEQGLGAVREFLAGIEARRPPPPEGEPKP